MYAFLNRFFDLPCEINKITLDYVQNKYRLQHQAAMQDFKYKYIIIKSIKEHWRIKKLSRVNYSMAIQELKYIFVVRDIHEYWKDSNLVSVSVY